LKMDLKTQHTEGFTLVEMVIVLATMALIIGGSLGLVASKVELNRAKETRMNLEVIMRAIDRYYDQFGYIPCPADGTNRFTGTAIGRGRGTGGGGPGVEPCIDPDLVGNTTPTAPEVVMGVVPVRNLAIPIPMMFDGWNHRISYVVDEKFTHNNTGGFNDTTGGSITVQNLGGADMTDKAVVVIISHGNRHHGAWSIKGVGGRYKAINKQPYEEENGEAAGGVFDDTFVQSIYSGDKFDDMVLFKTKWQLGTRYDSVK